MSRRFRAAEVKAREARELAELDEAVRLMSSPCCAKCVRGTKGFGLRPCGYGGRCPNRCHEKASNIDGIGPGPSRDASPNDMRVIRRGGDSDASTGRTAEGAGR